MEALARLATVTLSVVQRAEHNEGVVSTLKELDLPQQGLTHIELLGEACRHLVILFLQGNVIGCLENLHRLKAGA